MRWNCAKGVRFSRSNVKGMGDSSRTVHCRCPIIMKNIRTIVNMLLYFLEEKENLYFVLSQILHTVMHI